MSGGIVVIPAHNEASVIRRTLAALQPDATVHGVEVLVVCNGCQDETASLARLGGARVLEIPQAGKVAALNAGDAATDAYPRIYLDADIELSPGAVPALLRALEGTRPLVAAPRHETDLTGASRVVRSFYRAFENLPYLSFDLVGAGCYALNQAGRRRFEGFPDITADDLFVQGLFSDGERVVLDTATFRVRAPRTLTGLLAVRTRTYAGNAEAQASGMSGHMASTGGSALRSLLLQVRTGKIRAGDALVYGLVNLEARRRSARKDGGWLRDDSSRCPDVSGRQRRFR